ncbi:NAD-dependent protein deacetylase hst2-1 [Neonectria ditissima]|uniref:NCT transcriptional regulatory complex subunit B n=1 Tax=Neonectria ditissima TaxID=78410 RepID=A0A0P7AQ21_9HYPO|nr:NAD-dependent protein deacetylase hst2-1 [Neonectria ditissima]
MSDHEFAGNDDLSLPKATVQKIVTEILPPQAGVAFAKEARDLLIECCVEFITLISSEANEISEKEAKKTIACDHITKALEQLGFTDYVPAVVEAAQEHKETQKASLLLSPRLPSQLVLTPDWFATPPWRALPFRILYIFPSLCAIAAERSELARFSRRAHIAKIGRRRRNKNKPGSRVPGWLARRMGQEESSLDNGPPKTLADRSLSAVAEYIKSGAVKRIVVLTGAGISTAAGIPDFRSEKTGLYNNLARLNLPYAEAVFDIGYFRQHPEPFYVLAKELYPGTFQPTVSHAFIALLARKGLLQMLFTQNIDCLERAAGVPPEKIIEAHGSFASQRCIECKTEFPDDKIREHVFKGEVPHCGEKGCNGLVKPDIVFFGESLPKAFNSNTYQATMADLMLIIGTSLTVYPFAGLPEMAMQGKPRVLFNMEQVGQLGRRADDVIELGSCDAGIRKLADELGWRHELEKLWRDTVGDKEAERQLSDQKETQERLEDEVEKLAAEVEAVMVIKDESSSNDVAADEGDNSQAAATAEDDDKVNETSQEGVRHQYDLVLDEIRSGPPDLDQAKSQTEITISPPAPTSSNEAATEREEQSSPGGGGKAAEETRGANQASKEAADK